MNMEYEKITTGSIEFLFLYILLLLFMNKLEGIICPRFKKKTLDTSTLHRRKYSASSNNFKYIVTLCAAHIPTY